MTSPTLEHALSGNSIVVAAETPVAAELAGESVILDPDAGIYYGLKGVGTRIWELIQEPRKINEIRDTLLEEYEVEPDGCERDLFALLQDLASKELVEIKNETGA
jgi:hypothetical protein